MDQVQITQTYRDDHWVVRAELLDTPGGVLPPEPFTYENTGTDTLGRYYGVSSLEELQRFQVWTGEPIRKFGNRFVRYSVAEVHLTPGTPPDRTVALMRAGLTNLHNEIVAGAEKSTVYNIG